MLSIITAIDPNGTIGQNGAIPWHIPEEQQLFKKLTLGHAVIMGRKTFETSVKRPLKGRLNIVVSKTKTFPGTTPATSLKEAINIAKQQNKEIFVIGGEQIYKQALPLANTLHVSHLKKIFSGDAIFPKFNKKDWKATEQTEYPEFTLTPSTRCDPAKGGGGFTYIKYEKIKAYAN